MPFPLLLLVPSVAAGLYGVYPAGLAVATVTKILQNPESPFAKIICTPVAEVTNHLQLLLLELPEAKVVDPIEEKVAEEANKEKPDKTAKAKPNAPH